MREYKNVPLHVKAIEDRTVTGVFSVFGNVDSYGDRIWPGSFTKTFAERGDRILYLWQHDFDKPPTAVIVPGGLREIPREELPEDVLAEYPECLGGAEVIRTYLDTPRGNEALAAIRAGSPLQQSFAYDPLKFDFETIGEQRVRNLRELKMWEASDVLWGANEATRASKAWLDWDTLLGQLDAYLTDLKADKAGARHSAADIKALNAIHRAVRDLGTTECAGLLEEAEAEAEKSRAEEPSGPPLTLLRQKLALFELSLP